MGKVIGIDLGTTNSAMAVLEGGEPTVITNSEGGRTTPSVVAFSKSGERLVGTVARRQAVTNPENTVFSIKRFMGRKYGDVSEEMTIVPYKVIAADNGDASVEIGGKTYSPPEISAMILQKLRRDAEEYLGEKVEDAVVTVPAYFNDAQRQATKDAGRIAGLNVKRIINEPTAATLAYGLDRQEEATVAVYDLGGGTFDVSILRISGGVCRVLATQGDTHLGGDDLDRELIDLITAEVRDRYGQELTFPPATRQALRSFAEAAKVRLSNAEQATVEVDLGEGRTFRRTISRDEFPPDQELEQGMQFQAKSEDGLQLITILEVNGEDITIDTNHPLAGEPLTFDIEVLGVREATEEEISHGHVHSSEDHP